MNTPKNVNIAPGTVVSQSKFKTDTSGVVLVANVNEVCATQAKKGQHAMISANCSKIDYESFRESNEAFHLYFKRGEVWVDELRQSYVHSQGWQYFAGLTSGYNAAHGLTLSFVRNVNVPITSEYDRAGDGAITNFLRNARTNGITSPNVHIEVLYGQVLSEGIDMVEDVLNNDPILASGGLVANGNLNHTMAYLMIKTSYPIDAVNPEQFQAVAILFLRNNGAYPYRQPVGIWSFGTVAMADSTLYAIANTLNSGAGNESTVTAADLVRITHGEGVCPTDPPCNAANRNHASYNFALPAEALLNVDRNQPIAANTMMDMNVSLYQLQQDIALGYRLMMARVPDQAAQARVAGGGQLELLVRQFPAVARHDHLIVPRV